jgi:hypothetical protein
MVSISGYTVGEMLVVYVLMYVVLFAVVIARYMREVMDKEECGVRQGIRAIWVLIGGCVVLTILLWFPVRIGTVMCVLGMLFAWLFVDLKSVFVRWMPFSVSKDDVARTLAGEKRHG